MYKAKFAVLRDRFLRGFAAGGVSAMLAISSTDIVGVSELKAWGFRLGVACIVGGVTGGLMALDKYFRWKDEQGQ